MKSENSKITPIFIIGASRNGTTSLVNLINRFPEVAGIEHELHHGSHEAKLYPYYKYYKKLDTIDAYIDFIYAYSSEDYFSLADGDKEFHLRNRRTNFFEFFFDLADRYSSLTNKQFWVAKIDSAFFTDRAAFNHFFDLVDARYSSAKYIRIQRDLLPSVQSVLYMEGKKYHKRRRWPYKYFYLLAYIQSWTKTYYLKNNSLSQKKILDIGFENFIANQTTIIDEIRVYLGLTLKQQVTKSEPKTYKVNTSFNKHKRTKLGKADVSIINLTATAFRVFPGLMIFFSKINNMFSVKKNPVYRKLIKFEYYKPELKQEFVQQGADGLISHFDNIIHNNDATNT